MNTEDNGFVYLELLQAVAFSRYCNWTLLKLGTLSIDSDTPTDRQRKYFLDLRSTLARKVKIDIITCIH